MHFGFKKQQKSGATFLMLYTQTDTQTDTDTDTYGRYKAKL